VELRGQTKDIDPVSYVKVSFDIGPDAEESITQELTFQYYDRNDNLLDSEGIIPTVETITARLPVYVTKELPLVINYQEAPGARLSNTVRELTPSTITVSGDASQLKNVKNIVLGDVDLLDLTDESTRYETTFPIIIPEGCKNLSGVTRATLKIHFEDMGTTETIAYRFDYKNLPEGKTATILTEELLVRFFGASKELDSVYDEDVLVVADLSDYGAASGTYTVPATITVTNGADVGVLGEYQVEARIQQAEEESGNTEE
jgi:YbbR domain-containing protein